MTSKESEKIFTKSFVLLFASSFVSMVMYALVSSMTSYTLTIGATVTVAGLISGINVKDNNPALFVSLRKLHDQLGILGVERKLRKLGCEGQNQGCIRISLEKQWQQMQFIGRWRLNRFKGFGAM